MTVTGLQGPGFRYLLHEAEGCRVMYAWLAAMYTRVDVVLWGSQADDELLRAVEEVGTEVRRLESVASYFLPDSELSLLNRLAAHQAVAVSPTLFHLVQCALRAYDYTCGCFDVSVASDPHQPDTLNSISLDAEQRTVRYGQEGMRLDFSGLLKGYALEQVRPLLSAHGITHALVNMGNSSVLALGRQPDSSPWSVGYPDGTSVKLCDQCLTTSGNDTPDRRHILSPFIHRYVEGVRRTAVVTPDGITGEALSTALLVADAATRSAILARNPEAALIDC